MRNEKSKHIANDDDESDDEHQYALAIPSFIFRISFAKIDHISDDGESTQNESSSANMHLVVVVSLIMCGMFVEHNQKPRLNAEWGDEY